MPNVPEEIVADILSRLPVTSLCRFRCVSKPWHSLISSPLFIKSHLNHNTKHDRLILTSTAYDHTLDSYHFYSLHLQHDSSSSSSSVFAVHLKFPTPHFPSHCNQILGSCHGLLLIRDFNSSCFLVNPSTRDFKKLPNSPFLIKSSFDRLGLGYDSSTDDYKVVRIDVPDPAEDEDCAEIIACVYTLRTNSWRRIEDCPYHHCYTRTGPLSGFFYDEALHWIAIISSVGSNLNESKVIGLVNLGDEKFGCVPYPSSVDDFILDEELGVLEGCLCVFVLRDSGYEDVWVMREYGVRDSWTKFTITCDSYDYWKPLPLSWASDVLLQLQGNKLVLSDLRHHNKHKEVVVQGLPDCFEAETYVESLVSPNCRNSITRHHKV